MELTSNQQTKYAVTGARAAAALGGITVYNDENIPICSTCSTGGLEVQMEGEEFFQAMERDDVDLGEVDDDFELKRPDARSHCGRPRGTIGFETMKLIRTGVKRRTKQRISKLAK